MKKGMKGKKERRASTTNGMEERNEERKEGKGGTESINDKWNGGEE